MKKLLGAIAIAVTLITLLTLLIDLPEKLTSVYRAITKSAPTVTIKALFANQDALSLSPVTDDKSKGYSHFVWPAVYELHNISEKDVTINNIENILNPVKINEHNLQLVQRKDKDEVVELFSSFEDLTHKEARGVTERLPYTIKAGTKLYAKVFADYSISNNGRQMFCNDKSKCYKLLGLALGVAPKKDGTTPCVLKSYKTKIEYAKYADGVFEQKAILLIPGCKLNLDAIMKSVVPGGKK